MNSDYKVFDYIRCEKLRQMSNLELIASENYVSKQVMRAAGSVLTNKYAEGYPGHRYYGGCEFVDGIEQLAVDRAKALFGAEHANVQPHSGSQANMAAYMSILDVGDRILAPSLNSGGHLTHSSPVSFVSKLYDVHTYDVGQDGRYDYEAIRKIAHLVQPKLIVAGASAYPRTIRFDTFRQIADEVGALLMVDMAHIAGLVAAGEHLSPVPYADIVTSTTHKTLRGPRGGLILCKGEYAKRVDAAVFPRTQGGGLQHIVAAKAVCFNEAAEEEFQEYAHQVILNARALAQTLRANGLKLVTDGTDNHLLLIDLTDTGRTGKWAETMLDRAHITVNKNMIPGDTRKPSETSGIRIGTAAVTSRGMIESDMQFIGSLIADVIFERRDLDEVANLVTRQTARFPLRSDDPEV